MYNVFGMGDLSAFSFQKIRAYGDVPVLFSHYALNENTGTVEGFMEFQEPVWSHHIQAQWEQLGAASVTVLTFQHNDGNQSAASALNRVTKLACSPGFRLVQSGCCNPKLLAKANELAEKDQAKLTAPEFDEKTQAVIKQSLAVAERISESMVTKKELQDFGESSQKSSEELLCHVDEIKEKIAKDYEDHFRSQTVTISSQSEMISKQSVTISKLQSALEAKGKDMDVLTKKNHSQSVIIARLNTERDSALKKLQTLQNSQPGGRLLEKISRKLDDLEAGVLKKTSRKLDDLEAGVLEEMSHKLDDLWEESKKRRT
jgi:hypothetical protein